MISIKSAETNEELQITSAKGGNYSGVWREFAVAFDKNTQIGNSMLEYFQEEDAEVSPSDKDISRGYKINIHTSHTVKYNQEKGEYHALCKIGGHEFIAVIKESIGEVFNSYDLI